MASALAKVQHVQGVGESGRDRSSEGARIQEVRIEAAGREEITTEEGKEELRSNNG